MGQAAAGDDEVGCRAVLDLARRDHADGKEDGEDEEENGQGQKGFYLKWPPRRVAVTYCGRIQMSSRTLTEEVSVWVPTVRRTM